MSHPLLGHLSLPRRPSHSESPNSPLLHPSLLTSLPKCKNAVTRLSVPDPHKNHSSPYPASPSDWCPLHPAIRFQAPRRRCARIGSGVTGLATSELPLHHLRYLHLPPPSPPSPRFAHLSSLHDREPAPKRHSTMDRFNLKEHTERLKTSASGLRSKIPGGSGSSGSSSSRSSGNGGGMLSSAVRPPSSLP